MTTWCFCLPHWAYRASSDWNYYQNLIVCVFSQKHTPALGDATNLPLQLHNLLSFVWDEIKNSSSREIYLPFSTLKFIHSIHPTYNVGFPWDKSFAISCTRLVKYIPSIIERNLHLNFRHNQKFLQRFCQLKEDLYFSAQLMYVFP